MLDVGQANELKMAFRRADFTNADIKRLCDSHLLGSIRSVLRGEASINVISPVRHIIDCDVAPFIPEGWCVEEHKNDGQFTFDPSQIELYLDFDQYGSKYSEPIDGNTLRRGLADKPVLNANVLDYLVTHPDLIPEIWKKDRRGRTQNIYFWGTVYRDGSGNLVVRALCWRGEWHWTCDWLDNKWLGNDPAAMRAS